MNNKNKIRAALLVFTLILASIYTIFRGRSVSTDDAYLKADIMIIKPKVSGYITEIYIEDNQSLKKGALIAKIDDRDYKLKLNKAKASVEVANAKLSSASKNLEIAALKVANANFDLEITNSALDKASKDLSRSTALVRDSVTSKQVLDRDTDAYNRANNLHKSATSNLKIAELGKDEAQANLDEATSLLNSAIAEQNLAAMDLEYTEIRAMVDGTISKRSLQIGQLVSPALSLAYLVQNDIWVLANFKEVQIADMRPKQMAMIKVDILPGIIFEAEIDSLSPATGSEFSILPPENATGNFTKIVQRVPVKLVFAPNQDLSQLKSGLSCTVAVEFDNESY